MSRPTWDLPAAAEALSETPERLGSTLAELADLAADELRRANPKTDPEEARRLGARVSARLCLEVGGAYLPRGLAAPLAARNVTIWGDYDGTEDGPNGISALARRHRITEHEARAIIRREQARHRGPNGCDQETP